MKVDWKINCINRRPLCVGLGEVLFDCLPEGPRLGGAPANFAWISGQLGMEALAVSAIGEDELGKEAEEVLKEKGLPACLVHVPHETGHVDVVLHNGIPSYMFCQDPAYNYLPFTDAVKKAAEKADVVCFGTLAQWGPETRETVHKFLEALRPEAIRVFDVNLRGNFYNKEIIDRSLKHSDVVKCNDEELVMLTDYAGVAHDMDAYARYLGTLGVSCFILTEGAKGSTVYTKEGKSFLRSPKVCVRDTVGAGDAFTATFITSLIMGYTVKEAHERAVEVAGWVCTQDGAMPDLAEMKPISFF